jgi:hypothetical protein
MAVSDAAKAVKAEAEKPKVIEVEFRGNTYHLPGDPEEWDVEVMEALEEDRMVGCLKALIGESQWKQLKARHKLKMKDFEEVADVFLSAVGLTLGKSES